MENNLSKNILLSIIGVAFLIIAVVGVSYAVVLTTSSGTDVTKLDYGNVSMSFIGKENALSITNIYPLPDVEGKQLVGGSNVLDFNISSVVPANSKLKYEIVAEKVYDDEFTYSFKPFSIN